MVPGKIVSVFHQIVIQRPLQHDLPPGGGVHRPVDQHVRVPDGIGHAQGIGAEG